MIANEEQIKLAAKLYKCRDAAKKLLGDEYKVRIEGYRLKILHRQENTGADTLQSVLGICSLPHVKENSYSVMMFMAAAVEIIEPSKD